MNARLHLTLSRIAAAAFRRMCGNPTPLTVAAGYTDLANLATVNVTAPRLDPLVPGSRNLTEDNRTRYVHTSVSTDTAHAADNNGDGHATDVAPAVIPFRTDAAGNLLDRMSGEPLTRLPLF